MMGTCGIFLAKTSIRKSPARYMYASVGDYEQQYLMEYLTSHFNTKQFLREDAITNFALYDKYDHYLEIVSMPRGSYNIGNHPGTPLLKTWFV